MEQLVTLIDFMGPDAGLRPWQVKMGDTLFAVVTYRYPLQEVIIGRVIGFDPKTQCFTIRTRERRCWEVHRTRCYLSNQGARLALRSIERSARNAYNGRSTGRAAIVTSS